MHQGAPRMWRVESLCGLGYDRRGVVDQRTQMLPGVILFSRALGSADRLTIADLKVFVWIRHLRSGALDHIPADLPDRIAPMRSTPASARVLANKSAIVAMFSILPRSAAHHE